MIDVLTRVYRFSIPTWATILLIAIAVIAVAVVLPGCAGVSKDNNEAHTRGAELTKKAQPLDIFGESLPKGNRYWIFTEEDLLVELGTITPDDAVDPMYHAINRKIPAGSPEWFRIAEKFEILPPGLMPKE